MLIIRSPVSVSAPDQSSHSIYVFGGWGASYDNSDGGVYVLSLPSFTWILVNQESNQRSRHHCSIIGKNTMLVVGGIAPLDKFQLPTWTTQGCDDRPMFAQGLGMFSLNSHSWSQTYEPSLVAKPYQVHSSISNVIGGNANGGASEQTPIGGFNNKALGALLVPSKISSPPSGPSATSSEAARPIKSKGLGSGAIAGIVGASITGFVLILAVGFMCCLRRRQRSCPERPAEMNGHIYRSELSAQKRSSKSTVGSPPMELGNGKDKKIIMERSELGDVKEWVFELGAASITDKSLPPTPKREKSEYLWP